MQAGTKSVFDELRYFMVYWFTIKHKTIMWLYVSGFDQVLTNSIHLCCDHTLNTLFICQTLFLCQQCRYPCLYGNNNQEHSLCKVHTNNKHNKCNDRKATEALVWSCINIILKCMSDEMNESIEYVNGHFLFLPVMYENHF